MSRELCILSGPVDPTSVKHHLVKNGTHTAMPVPCFLILEGDSSPTGTMLYRFDENGECVGDTWHSNLEEAKKSASSEYLNIAINWQTIPENCDMVEFSLSKYKDSLTPCS